MTRKTETDDALDTHIGKRIREQRENRGMTQTDLAVATGVSYQQIHKYERGADRISAGRLGLIAQSLHMGVQDFYDGFAQGLGSNIEGGAAECHLCLEVARNFRQINNPRYREALHLLVRVLAD